MVKVKKLSMRTTWRHPKSGYIALIILKIGKTRS